MEHENQQSNIEFRNFFSEEEREELRRQLDDYDLSSPRMRRYANSLERYREYYSKFRVEVKKHNWRKEGF